MDNRQLKPEPMNITYTLTHPQLSQPLILDATTSWRLPAIEAWATMYILRTYDEMVVPELWDVESNEENW